MPIYKPKELHQFLDQLNISPKKGLSQNFLIDGNILRKIVSAAHIEPGDLVIEIGPGPGSLTEELLKSGAHVIAVEKDITLATALERLKTADNRLEIYQADILTFPLEAMIAPRLKEGLNVKVIANLPYHLTTPILVALIKQRHLFSTFTLMVQEEVARRFTGHPNTRDYSSFTVFLNFFSKPHYEFAVSKNCFFPIPKVDSAVVTFELTEPPAVSDEESFFKMTRRAFEHRRKMLRSSLRELYPSINIEEALSYCGFNPLARPENLSLYELLQLFEALRKLFLSANI